MTAVSASSIPHSAGDADFARVATRVRDLAATCPYGFWFLSDLHVPSNHCASGELLARFVAETGLRTVVFGGDVPEAFGDRASLDASIERYRRLWVAPVERVGGRFLPIHGNHDFCIRASAESGDGYTYPAAETRAIVLDTAAVRGGAECDPSSCAYFADDPTARIRFVALDTHDAIDSSRPYWGVADGFSDAQRRWFAERALGTLPDDWRLVVASHAPLAGVAAVATERELFAPVCALLAPLAREGRVLLAISGHHHAERQSCLGGVWHVTEPCDAAYLDYIHGSEPWVPGLPVKAAGTWAGQTFDAVQFDPARGLAHFTRVGGGADRTLRLAPLRLRTGETRRLVPAVLPGPVAWSCHDGDACDRRPNPARRYDFFFEYHGDVADISPDGLLRAKRPGEAVAIATAPDGTREYVAIAVS